MPTKTQVKSKKFRRYTWNILVNGTKGGVDSSSSYSWTDSVTYGDNVPGWRDKIRRGQNATTSLLGTSVSIRYKPGSFRVERPKTGLPQTQPYVSGVEGRATLVVAPIGLNPASIDTTRANNAALRKFNSRIREVNTAIEGGVALGELRETLYGIANPARALRKLVDSWRNYAVILRSRYWRRKWSRDLERALVESWLEYSFHWKPLLSDIDSACRALAEINTGQSIYSGSVSAVGSSDEYASYNEANSVLNRFVFRETDKTVGTAMVIYRGAVRVNPRNSAGMLPELLGFNPSSWLPTAWELVPYSFVIDYFTNIGDIILGWSQGTTGLSWCNRTIRQEYTTTRTVRTWLELVRTGTYSNATSVSSKPASVVIRKKSVSRGTYTGSLIPSFQFEIPGLGSSKWLNLAALYLNRSNDRSFRYGD